MGSGVKKTTVRMKTSEIFLSGHFLVPKTTVLKRVITKIPLHTFLPNLQSTLQAEELLYHPHLIDSSGGLSTQTSSIIYPGVSYMDIHVRGMG